MLVRFIILFVSIFFRVTEPKSTRMIETVVNVDEKEDTIEEFPHSASLSIECVTNETIKYYCGGSIANQDYILTAALCVEQCRPDMSIIIVGVGATNYSETEKHYVIDVVIHEKYNHTTFEYDIALLRLNESLKLSKNMQRVYFTKETQAYDIAEVAGWSAVNGENKGIKSLTLKRAQQTVYSVEKCKKMLGYIPPHTFCAKFSEDIEENYAKVYSGSALVIQRFIQIGIVSYKNFKVSPGLVVYTNVSAHSNWIQKNMVLTTCGLW